MSVRSNLGEFLDFLSKPHVWLTLVAVFVITMGLLQGDQVVELFRDVLLAVVQIGK